MKSSPLLATPLLATLLLLAGCATGPATAPEPDKRPDDPLLAASVGVERILRFSHPACAGHFGVDAVRMPVIDPAFGEMRDNYLYLVAGGTGIYGALVNDRWELLSDAYWPVGGLTVPWSDLKVGRITDAKGVVRVVVYFVSRGDDQLEIADVTDFPEVRTSTMPLEIGLPIKVRGAHTVQLHLGKGVMVLNGVDATAPEVPKPLTYGAVPAVFYDIRTDPLRPRRLSMFLGPEDGDQTLFDSQFLRIGGRDIWAPSIAQPLKGGTSYCAFYDFSDPAGMADAERLAAYYGPASGSMHNVVQLPPTPDGTPRLAAGFEAWAFAAGPTDVVSKAAVLDASELLDGKSPRLCAFLVDDHNRRHSVHNPASRLVEVASHTWDVVPLAHFTGGYFCYQCADDQDSVRMLAHVPLSATIAGEGAGRKHPRMSIPVWLAVYNGAWDIVASHFGDFVSSTDREASFLIEPSWGFTRHFGTYIASVDGTVPRISIASGVPEVGREMRIRVSGLEVGGRLTLLISTAAAERPTSIDRAGAIWCDLDRVFATLEADVTAETEEFVLTAPDQRQLVMTAYELGASTPQGVLKSPAAIVRLLPARR